MSNSSTSPRNSIMPSFYKAVQNATRRFSLTIGLDRDQPPPLKSPVLERQIFCGGGQASSSSPRKTDRSGSVPIRREDLVINHSKQTAFQVHRVSECDDHFFETFASLQWKLENAKLARLRGEGEDGRTKSPTLDMSKRATVKIGQMTKFSKKEMDLLYMEVLYTIMHKVGTTPGTYTQLTEDLYRYAQNAFNLNVEEHKMLLAKVSTAKPPILVLNVVLLEAKDLLSKDANGFSDPYCMLGIIPAKRVEQGRKKSPTDSPLHSPVHSKKLDFHDSDTERDDRDKKSNQSLRKKKLGGSFRKKNKEGGSNKSELPAKVIKASSVQRCTLNPKWSEKFQLDFDDPEQDIFHLDIWDHDDEDSVVDAVKKLNEIQGLKGLGRYFKQVAQSARADTDDSVDDFLGCVDINLSNIPSVGLLEWYKLQGRTAKSQVKGSIHLKMWLGTREDRGGEDDDLLDIKQHEGLIKIFAENEIRKSNQDATKWTGQLPQPALTILHQHAVQGDLTEVQQAMCHWLAYSKMHYDTMLDYGFLHKLLNNLTTLWVPTSLSKDEEDLLSESFSEFLTHCYDQIVRHRELYNSAEKQICLKRLEDMLRCIRTLHASALFKKAMPFQKDFMTELPFLIKKSSVGFYEKRKRTACTDDADGFTGLIQLLTTLNAGCYRAFHSFNKIFERTTSVNYFYITYKQWDRSLQDALCSLMADAVNKNLLAFDLSSKSTGNGNAPAKYDQALVPALELYLALTEFFSYRQHLTDEEKLKLAPLDFSHWFESAVAKWLSLIKDKFFKRIELACQIDKKIVNNATKSELKETSSHADVCHCITQIIEFWNYLEFPPSTKSADYLNHLVEDLCKGVEYYADKTFSLIAHEGCYDISVPLTDKMVEDVCVAVNNTGHVREMMINFPKSLHFNDFIQSLSQAKIDEKTVAKTRTELDEAIEECDRSVTAQLDMALNMLVDRQREALKKHVFHLAWSPDGCQLEAAIKPLIKQLDVRLIDFHKWLLPHIFIRLLMAQFRAVLQEMKAMAIENPGQDANFHKRLLNGINFLVDYFHASGQGVPKSTILDDKVYKDITTLLQLNQVPTTALIQQYYETLWKDQEDLKDCKYGFLNVRSYYNAQSSLVVLDVVNAKSIIPLDSNGLSDPFVIIEIVPTSNFQSCKIFKTKIIQKTLNPVFDETFQFPVPQRRPLPGWLHFVVMDHDFLMTNDFAGEAFLRLDEIPGCMSNSTERAGSWKTFCVPLMHPDHKSMAAVKVLETRKDDKDAVEFLRHLDAIRRT